MIQAASLLVPLRQAQSMSGRISCKHIRRAGGMPSFRHLLTAWEVIPKILATLTVPPRASIATEWVWFFMADIVTIVTHLTQTIADTCSARNYSYIDAANTPTQSAIARPSRKASKGMSKQDERRCVFVAVIFRAGRRDAQEEAGAPSWRGLRRSECNLGPSRSDSTWKAAPTSPWR